MKNSKKAQVFSLIAVLMSALFIMLFSGASHLAYDRNVKTTETAIETTDQFVTDLEQFSEEGARETARENLLELIKYHNNTNEFENFTRSFEDCFLTGTFKANYSSGTTMNCSDSSNTSYESTMKKIFDIAQTAYDINITHKNANVTITLSSPFQYKVTTTSIVEIEKERGGIGNYGWTRDLVTTVYLDVTGMPDPLSMNTPYERTIKLHPDKDMFQGRVSNIDGNLNLLAEYINNSYFIIDQTAPTLTQILEGNIVPEEGDYEYGNNSFGITSYLNVSDYQDNETAMTEYRYDVIKFNCKRLRRIDHANISDDLIFERKYLIGYLNISDSKLLDVCDCCDEKGCAENCG